MIFVPICFRTLALLSYWTNQPSVSRRGTNTLDAESLVEHAVRRNQLNMLNVAFTEQYYNGHVSTAEGGGKCETWAAMLAGNPSLKPEMFPDYNVSAANNYCRDPYKTGRPQCVDRNTDVNCNLSLPVLDPQKNHLQHNHISRYHEFTTNYISNDDNDNTNKYANINNNAQYYDTYANSNKNHYHFTDDDNSNNHNTNYNNHNQFYHDTYDNNYYPASLVGYTPLRTLGILVASQAATNRIWTEAVGWPL
ncbi:hypothetical protein DPMN_031313 [Dreissena polymorpha]|uniref:Kringle domain-containing protein n=1 Tax=Dreissena polymorpha TaxID=45954 RepID=A0A9D4M2C1_DREPO|nr:hypothetical protein DPMN_031313 [Dreissena polymorpha]